MSKVFQFYGENLIFSDDMVWYNEIRKQNEQLKEKIFHDFKKKYDSYGSLDTLVERADKDASEFLIQGAEWVVSCCAKENRFDIDIDSFFDRYQKRFLRPWFEAFEEIYNKRMEIILEGEQLAEYRRQRRDARTRMIGGGFGFSGAMKGMLQAGAFNMAWGAVHGTVNLIGNGLTKIGNSIQKTMIYKDKDTLYTLEYGLEQALDEMHLCLCQILGRPGLGDTKSADVLFNNIERMPPNLVQENLMKILLTNPYKVEAYHYCLKNYGDPQGQLATMAVFFGRKKDVLPYRDELVHGDLTREKISAIADESVLATETEQLKNRMERYGVTGTPLLEACAQRAVELDLAARTVDGTEYPDRAAAAEARQNYTEVMALLGANYDAHKENAVIALHRLEGSPLKDTPFGEKYLHKVNELVVKFTEQETLQRVQTEQKTTNLLEVRAVIAHVSALQFHGEEEQKRMEYLAELRAKETDFTKQLESYQSSFAGKSGAYVFFRTFGEILAALIIVVLGFAFLAYGGFLVAAIVAFVLYRIRKQRKTAKHTLALMQEQGQTPPQALPPVSASVNEAAGTAAVGASPLLPDAVADTAPLQAYPGKKKLIAALLAFFLGGLGIHKFYLGKTIQGIIYILLCWTFIPALIAFIEGIRFLVISEETFQRVKAK